MTIGNVVGGIHNSIIAGRDVIVNFLAGDTGQQAAQAQSSGMPTTDNTQEVSEHSVE